MRQGLVDVIDLSVHPLLAGHGGLLLREGLDVPLRLVSVKSFSQIVKLTYQVQPGQQAGAEAAMQTTVSSTPHLASTVASAG